MIFIAPILLLALCFSGCGGNDHTQKVDNKIPKDSVQSVSATGNALSSDQKNSPKNDKYEATEAIINKIPSDIRKEFRISFSPLWSYLNENGEQVNDLAIHLFSDNIGQIEENYGKSVQPLAHKTQTKYYDFLRDYSYVYGVEGAEFKFRIDIKTYGFKFEDQEEKEIVYCIGEDGYMSTGKGLVRDINSLIMKYPDNLYSIDSKSLKEFGSPEAEKYEYDCAYAYIPNKVSVCDMTFYFRNNDLVYTELYFSLDGCRWSNAEPIRDSKEVKHPFQVTTAAEYHADLILPCNYDVNNDGIKNDSWDCRVDYMIPEVDPDIPDADLINAYLETDKYCDDIKQFQSGRYPERIGDEYSLISYTYEVHKYKGLSALVLTKDENIHEGGGGTTSWIYYFNNQTGRQISAVDYAGNFGLSDKEILDLYNGDQNDWPVDSIADANFYLDENGKLIVIVNYPY